MTKPHIFTAQAAILLIAISFLPGCTTPVSAPQTEALRKPLHYQIPDQPEGSSGYSAKPGWATRKFAVAAANPLATDAGYQVLKAGGSAVDAAIAVQMVLTLVEPQSSGIGGGAFLLHHSDADAAAGAPLTQAYDGRETAPAAATEKLFLLADGKPMPFAQAAVGGRSVGAPGTVNMLHMAHRQHGKLPWAELFIPAITLAENGFKVSARLNNLLGTEKHLKTDPIAAAYFYDAAGKPWPVGYVLKNPDLAQVLKRIALHGADAMQTGDIAKAIVQKVQSHPTNPGTLNLQDLAQYQAKKRSPLCTDYRAPSKDYRLCGMPPPSSGAIAVAQILGILQASGVGEQAGAATTPSVTTIPSAQWLHSYTEAARLAFADRAQYLGDPDFVTAPAGDWASLVAPAYLAERAKLIGPQAMQGATPGTPGTIKVAYGMGADQPEYGTSHISIIDGYGNALSMTTTLEDAFGSRQMVNLGLGLSGGFLLNNELTDFNFVPNDAQGRPTANRVQPGKRPRSSMSPTLVFDKTSGQVMMSGGSPGGALIIHYAAKLLYGTLTWGFTTQQAINLPNFGITSPAAGAPLLLEVNRFPASTVNALKARGHTVRELPMTSGLQAIQRTGSGAIAGLYGGADPRREGVVQGD